MNPENYDDSTEPRRCRKLSDIYNCSEEVEMEDELLLMGVDEPRNFGHSVKELEWREAIKRDRLY